MLPDDKRILNLAISKDLLKHVDKYRFKNEFQSRSEAVRHLIRIGLKQEGHEYREG